MKNATTAEEWRTLIGKRVIYRTHTGNVFENRVYQVTKDGSAVKIGYFWIAVGDVRLIELSQSQAETTEEQLLRITAELNLP